MNQDPPGVTGLAASIKALNALPNKIRRKVLTEAIRQAGGVLTSDMKRAIREAGLVLTGLWHESIALDQIRVSGTRVKSKIGIAPPTKQVKRRGGGKRTVQRTTILRDKGQDARRYAHIPEFGSKYVRARHPMRTAAARSTDRALEAAIKVCRDKIPGAINEARRDAGGLG